MADRGSSPEVSDGNQFKWDEIVDYLANGTYPEGIDKGKKSIIRRRSKDYRLICGKLFYTRHVKGKNDPNIKVLDSDRFKHFIPY